MSEFKLIQQSLPASDADVALVSAAVSVMPTGGQVSLGVAVVARLLRLISDLEEEVEQDPASALIKHILEHPGADSEAVNLLETWNEGNFDALRREWPELPEEVYIGADPLHEKTRPQLITKVGTVDGKRVAVGVVELGKTEPTEDRYKLAFELLYNSLAWMQEKGQTPSKYLGWNLGEALTAMYRDAKAQLEQRDGRELHLVWNKPRNECVGFIDKADALHAATGRTPRGYESTLANAWRDIYGEDQLHRETVLVKEKDA